MLLLLMLLQILLLLVILVVHLHSVATCLRWGLKTSHVMLNAGLFSATQTEAVVQLARAGLRNAVRVKVAVMPSAEQKQQQRDRVQSGQAAGPSAAQRTPSSLEIQYLICDSVQKLQQLIKFIQVYPVLSNPSQA